MAAKLCDQKSKQGHTTTSGIPCKLQHNEIHNQRSRQTIVQARWDNIHQTGKTGSGPGTRQVYY